MASYSTPIAYKYHSVYLHFITNKSSFIHNYLISVKLLMTTATIVVEVASSNPAETIFKVFCDFHVIAPKVNPSVFKSIETVEGNGGVGTIKLVTFGDGNVS